MLVEAIEDEFIPVLVYNNRKGDDAAMLKRFNEPSWNNPVVRYLDASQADVIPRQDGVWSVAGTAARMSRALKAAKRKVPGYLAQMATPAKKTEVATFAMHCYWEGEAKLGSIKGVLNTRSAWRDSLEVVQLEFDPTQVDYDVLVKSAQEFECASKVYAHSDDQWKVAKKHVGNDAKRVAKGSTARDAKLSDQVYYVRNSVLRHLPMTEFQATKINGVLYNVKDSEKRLASIRKILSPRQSIIMDKVLKMARENPKALEAMVWPDDDQQLPEYTRQLAGRLAAKGGKR